MTARRQHPERRPINGGRTPLDRYCRACLALPGTPCTVKGVQSPPEIRTREDERQWKVARIREVQDILRRLDGRQPVPVGDLTHALQQANRTLIHESR
jgi:uncharacterized protein YceH (UPF0502 family)